MDAKDMPPKPAPPIAPQLPPQAFTKTDTGAVITAMMFFDYFHYFQVTGDHKNFDTYVDPECNLCNSFRDQVLSTYKKNGYAVAEPLLFEDAIISVRNGDAYRITGRLVSKGARAYEPLNSRVIQSPVETTDFIIDVAWANDRWVVTEGGVPDGVEPQ